MDAVRILGTADPQSRPLAPDLRWALGFVRPYARKLVLVAVLSLVGTGLSLVLPYLSRELIDRALLPRDFGALLRIVLLFLGISVTTFVLNVWSGMVYTRASADILFDMRLDLYRHLQRLSSRFYAVNPIGEIVSRINNDLGEVQRVTSEAVLAWASNLLFLVGTIGILVWLDLRLFLVSLVVLPPSLWALVRYRRRLEFHVARMRQRSANIGTFLIETIQGMRLVVTSNAHELEAGRFREKNDSFIESLMGMRWFGYLAGGLPGLLLTFGTALVFLYGGSRVIAGAISLGTFVAFMAYQTRLLSPVQALMGLYTNVVTARVSLARVLELLEAPVDVLDPPSPKTLEEVHGALQFENVRLSHGRGGEVLRGLNLSIQPGETVALMGPSGSGKSTVADLLVRHLDPDEGRILLDGCDIRDLRLADLRRHVVTVDQQPFVFHASMAENIRYARPDASALEVTEAVRAAGLDALLATLPDGIETPVGERGWALSAGERQRVALARAFLANPAVLVLDEATAALDHGTEAEVIQGWTTVMRGRTTLVVTHRPEPAKHADRIVNIEAGQIASGSGVTSGTQP